MKNPRQKKSVHVILGHFLTFVESYATNFNECAGRPLVLAAKWGWTLFFWSILDHFRTDLGRFRTDFGSILIDRRLSPPDFGPTSIWRPRGWICWLGIFAPHLPNRHKPLYLAGLRNNSASHLRHFRRQKIKTPVRTGFTTRNYWVTSLPRLEICDARRYYGHIQSSRLATRIEHKQFQASPAYFAP